MFTRKHVERCGASCHEQSLELLPNHECTITDVVWREAAGRAAVAAPSTEALVIARFLEQHPGVEIRRTRLGALTAGVDGVRHLGELSTHSRLFDLAGSVPPVNAVVLFEDHWLSRHAGHFPPGVTQIGTVDFLFTAERLGQLASAQKALADIRRSRPTAPPGTARNSE